MGSRERKRAARRKRKSRSAARPTEAPTQAPTGETEQAASDEQPATRNRDPIAAGYARAEARNQEAREALHPLYEGERPTVVTIGAAFSALVALLFWVSTGIALFTDTTVQGRTPHPLQLAIIAAVVTAMAWGMWMSRYWAVLGFQMLLVIFLLAAIAGLVTATTVPQLIGTVVLVAVCITFFIFMVKAMARIQMPHRLPRD